MTKFQRIFLMGTLWPDACGFQGWNSEDRELRLEVLSAAVKRPLASASDLGALADFDQVRQHLEALAGKLTQHDGRAARYRVKFHRQLRCLALYVEDATAYAKTVIRDKFHRAGCDHEGFANADARRLAEWLSAAPTVRFDRREQKLVEGPSQLEQLVMTLDERLHAKGKEDGQGAGFRVRAGHTMHDMLTAAGLQCPCKDCSRRHVTLPEAEADTPAWADLEAEAALETAAVGSEEEPF